MVNIFKCSGKQAIREALGKDVGGFGEAFGKLLGVGRRIVLGLCWQGLVRFAAQAGLGNSNTPPPHT